MTRYQPGKRILAAAIAALLVSAAPALGIGIEDVVDGGNTYAWQRVELPGTVCSNGSQYRFWYYDIPDLEQPADLVRGRRRVLGLRRRCSGQAGILGAAQPERHPDRLHHAVQGRSTSRRS